MVVMGNESNSWLLSSGKIQAYNEMIWKNSKDPSSSSNVCW